MSIVLSPDVERQIEEMVLSGRFTSADDCIRKSVQLMREHEEDRQRRREEIKRLVDEGNRDLEEGRFTVYDDESLNARIQQIAREGREEIERRAASQ